MRFFNFIKNISKIIIRALKNGLEAMPIWKRFMLGISISFAVLAGIGLLVTSFVATGGTSFYILGICTAALSVGSGLTGSVYNGHSAVEFFKQRKYVKAIFACLGCAECILSWFGAIFHITNAVNIAAQIGVSAGSCSGTAISTVGTVPASLLEKMRNQGSEEKYTKKQKHDNFNSTKAITIKLKQNHSKVKFQRMFRSLVFFV